jgi:DNA-nicking Smr family endonuclease
VQPHKHATYMWHVALLYRMATQRKAKPNQTRQTHTRGPRQALTISAEGRARPRIGARPAARVATYEPDRHKNALPRQRATLGSRSAPEMKAARQRPGPPVCTAAQIDLHRETEEKARQPKIMLGAIARTRHTARLRNAKRSRTRNPKPTHGARDRPKQPQPRAGRD